MASSEAERHKYLANIHEEVLRLSRLVTEILDLRRIESGRVEMETKEVMLTRIVERVVERFQTLAAEKKISLLHNVFHGQFLVYADPDRLEQVLINLLDNAIRNTPAEGRVDVFIQDSGDELEVSVRDTGPGIAYEEQSLIWERFYKVDKSRTRRGGGTGLGLAIVKEIVEAHGGSIEVISKPGEGSTFSFTIPKVNKQES
jgi:signal transduction histidine kinase